MIPLLPIPLPSPPPTSPSHPLLLHVFLCLCLQLLSDEEFFHTVAEGMFDVWDACHRGELSFNDAIAGFKKLGLS